MREILFRGKTEEGTWFEGSLYQYTVETPSKTEKHYKIQEFNHGYCDEELLEPYYMSGFDEKVIPETVGQFTGLTDKNGNKIFEGDIVKDEYGRIMEVVWRENLAKFALKLIKTTGKKWTENFLYADMGEWFDLANHLPEVIGNIHDNPELLEVQL